MLYRSCIQGIQEIGLTENIFALRRIVIGLDIYPSGGILSRGGSAGKYVLIKLVVIGVTRTVTHLEIVFESVLDQRVQRPDIRMSRAVGCISKKSRSMRIRGAAGIHNTGHGPEGGYAAIRNTVI